MSFRPKSRSPSQSSPEAGKSALDEDVDVEQCSDNEDDSKRSLKPDPDAKLVKNGKDNKDVPPKRREKEKVKIMKAKCNCEELRYVDCFLETKELWDKFNELGTEMIITKTGR